MGQIFYFKSWQLWYSGIFYGCSYDTAGLFWRFTALCGGLLLDFPIRMYRAEHWLSGIECVYFPTRRTMFTRLLPYLKNWILQVALPVSNLPVSANCSYTHLRSVGSCAVGFSKSTKSHRKIQAIYRISFCPNFTYIYIAGPESKY